MALANHQVGVSEVFDHDVKMWVKIYVGIKFIREFNTRKTYRKLWICDHENVDVLINENVWWRNVAEDSMWDKEFKETQKTRHEYDCEVDLENVNVQQR